VGSLTGINDLLHWINICLTEKMFLLDKIEFDYFEWVKFGLQTMIPTAAFQLVLNWHYGCCWYFSRAFENFYSRNFHFFLIRSFEKLQYAHWKTKSITLNKWEHSAQYHPNICTKCSISFETCKRSLAISDLISCIKNFVDRLLQLTKPVEAKVQNITVNCFRSLGAQTNFLCATNDLVFQCIKDTDYNSLGCIMPKLWLFLTFFKSFWYFLFKKYQNYKIWSFRLFGELQRVHNDTNCSSWAFGNFKSSFVLSMKFGKWY
jgi:hypothetical protein